MICIINWFILKFKYSFKCLWQGKFHRVFSFMSIKIKHIQLISIYQRNNTWNFFSKSTILSKKLYRNYHHIAYKLNVTIHFYLLFYVWGLSLLSFQFHCVKFDNSSLNAFLTLSTICSSFQSKIKLKINYL